MAEVRLLTESDADEFWRFRLDGLEESPHAFAEAADELRATPPPLTADRLRQSTADNFVLGAFGDRRLVGPAGFYRFTGAKTAHKGRVWGVYVHPDFRGQGIARTLLTDLLARIRRVDGIQQLLLTVAATQMPAIALYESIGFRRFGFEVRSLIVDNVSVDEEHRVLMLDGASRPR